MEPAKTVETILKEISEVVAAGGSRANSERYVSLLSELKESDEGGLLYKKQSIVASMVDAFGNIQEQIYDCERQQDETTKTKNILQAEGDLRENQGYHEAMDRLAQLAMSMANLINRQDAWNLFINSGRLSGSAKFVSIGSLVKLHLAEQNKIMSVLIVPPLLGKATIDAVATSSKVGEAVLGKKIGEKISITTPRKGNLTYTIENIF